MRISEQLGTQFTYQMLSEVLEYFTTRVIDNGGVIIDYYCDGLAAMWNAPQNQPDHALRACHSAIAMVSEINQLNQRWRERLHRPLRIGVGIHTDSALVGNAGYIAAVEVRASRTNGQPGEPTGGRHSTCGSANSCLGPKPISSWPDEPSPAASAALSCKAFASQSISSSW